MTLLATLSSLLGAAALAGLVDVGLHGDGLDAATSAGTVGLWMALSALPATLIAGLVALVTSHSAGGGTRAATLLRTGAIFSLVAPLAAAALGAARFDPPRLSALDNATATNPRAMHVVLIVLDTLRADHLGAYGHAGALSPAFDALAERATLFDRCFAPAAWTVPSHASLFTGLHPVSHGASFEHDRWLDDEFTTLAETLRAAGHRTAAFVANPHLALSNLDQGFELYREVGAPFAALALRRPLAAIGAPARWIDEGTAQAVREIDRFLLERDRTTDRAPLFLFVNLLEPHWRHLPPFAERREALESASGYWTATAASARFYGPLAMARGGLERPDDLAALRTLYRAEVRYQDARLGELVALLDERLGVEKTLLIITSDHGENLGEGGRFDHVFALNDHLIHVPMLLRQPDHFRPGDRRQQLCQLVDVPATVRDVLGIEPVPSERSSGKSLVADSGPTRRYVHSEGDPYLDHLERMSEAAGSDRDIEHFAQPLRAVRDDRFKLVWSAHSGTALFDLDADPDELRNVASKHPERRAALERELDRWYESQPRYTPQPDTRSGPAARIDAATRARLDALGYTP